VNILTILIWSRNFYQILGFTEDMHKNEEFPEEFIWSKYHEDGAKRAYVCLQVKIIAYLRENK
jgi:hypothetical protein